MEDTLISFETAKLAKEKGFKVALNCFNNVYDLGDDKLYKDSHRDRLSTLKSGTHYLQAPTQSILQKWLREVHNIWVYVSYGSEYLILCEIYNHLNHNEHLVLDHSSDTYEQALEQGLIEALKLTPTK